MEINVFRNLFLIGFSFILCFFFFSCGISTGGGDGASGSCQNVLKVHPQKMNLSVELDCPYDSTCDARLLFENMEYSDSLNSCYGDFEYLFVSEKQRLKIHRFEEISVALDSEEHIRFSLLDETNTEKYYDVDLSKIIHSFEVVGDSVKIDMLSAGFSEIRMDCPSSWERCRFDSDYEYVMVGIDSTWSNSFTFDQYLYNQSSMESDSIHVYGKIIFR
jgi:hypothetical protein